MSKEETQSKKKKAGRIIRRVIIFFVIANLVLALPSASFAETLVLKSKGDHERTVEEYTRVWLEDVTGIDSYAFEEKYQMESFLIPSTGTKNYRIPAFHYMPEGEPKGFVVMAHGMNSSHIVIYHEAEVFLLEGFEVYSFDERKFGESTFGYVGYGYLEGMDVKDVYQFAYDQAEERAFHMQEQDKNTEDTSGKRYLCGIWGQSMGGAGCENAMDEEPLVSTLDFAILDCPMGPMEDLTGAPKPQNWLAGKMNPLVSGFSFDEQNPIPQLKNVTADVLLLLAGDEKVIPKQSTQAIQKVLEEAPCELTVYVSDGSEHADIIVDDSAGYRNTIHDFLESIN